MEIGEYFAVEKKLLQLSNLWYLNMGTASDIEYVSSRPIHVYSAQFLQWFSGTAVAYKPCFY